MSENLFIFVSYMTETSVKYNILSWQELFVYNLFFPFQLESIPHSFLAFPAALFWFVSLHGLHLD